jgi:predicted lipase
VLLFRRTEKNAGMVNILSRCTATVGITILLLAFAMVGKAQPKFDAVEYADLLWLAFYGFADSSAQPTTYSLKAGKYQKVFSSKEVGLFNCCELYVRSDSAIVLSLRGTVNKPQSWLENFYAGMIPAIGKLQLDTGYTFNYYFAQIPEATVHTGWALGTGFLVRAYMPVLEQLLGRGLNRLVVTGHSQGGALAFLNASYLHYALGQKYPSLQIKCVASAAPKPGNQYYAYDLEHALAHTGVWRVVNATDWVPETPVAVQSVTDFNMVNPFSGAMQAIKKQKLPDRLAFSYMYRSMRNSSHKTAKRYNRFLGRTVGKQVSKVLPGYTPPAYTGGSHFVTVGSPVVLLPNEAYRQQFAFDGKNVFIHHLYASYQFLLNHQFLRQ